MKLSQTHVLAETVARTCGDGCTYLRGWLHVLAGTDLFTANVYDDGRKRLRERLQTFASERGKTGDEIVSPILDKRKGSSGATMVSFIWWKLRPCPLAYCPPGSSI